MKKINLFIVTLAIGFTNANAQTDNPYAIFGYEGKVLETPEEETDRQSLFVNTNDTTQRLKSLVFNYKTQLIEYLDRKDEVYKTDSLLPTFVLRFINPDPHEKNYPGLTPYNFVGNMPINAIDPDGRDVIILFYTSGNNRGDEMFRAAALTRKHDIQNSKNFDPSKDIVVVMAVSDMSKIQDKVHSIVTDYSSKYGQTREFSIWSHAALDGPIGTSPTSSNAKDDYQMSMKGWGSIEFNWKDSGAKANFFGCNTGVNYEKKEISNYYDNGSLVPEYSIKTTSFANEISSLANFKGVTVSGQSSSAFPSQYTNYRLNSENGADNFINWEKNGVVSFQRTYLVGGYRRSQDWNLNEQNVALPMQNNRNGMTINRSFQQGEKKP